jgi:hypothetical protein
MPTRHCQVCHINHPLWPIGKLFVPCKSGNWSNPVRRESWLNVSDGPASAQVPLLQMVLLDDPDSSKAIHRVIVYQARSLHVGVTDG